MRCNLRVLATIACVGGLGGTAFGADLPAPTPLPLPPSPALPVDYAGGFYVRIDGGLGFNNSPSLQIHPGPVGRPAVSLGDPNYRGTYTSSNFPHSRLGDGKFGDLGVGYQLSNFFRFDVTGEYRGDMGLSATNILNDQGTTATPFGTLAARNSATTLFKGQLSSAIFLANGYVDLGNYWGLTPFVGAGIGGARNFLSGVTETGVFTARVANNTFSAPFRGSLANQGHTSLAWALMGGAAFDITPNLKLEVAYRYLDFGRLRSGKETIVLPTGAAVPQPFSGRSRDLVSNDVKIGLRWSFNVPPPPPQEPLTRRY